MTNQGSIGEWIFGSNKAVFGHLGGGNPVLNEVNASPVNGLQDLLRYLLERCFPLAPLLQVVLK